MSVIEAGARGGSIAILLLAAAILVRDGRGIIATRYAALFAGGVAATLVVFAPPLALDPTPWLLPLRILAFGNPAVFWVVAAALFDDQFELSWPPIVGWLAMIVLGLWAVYGAAGPRPFLPLNGVAVVCLGLAVLNVFAGRPGDLVEARRRLRLVFVVSVALFIAAVIVAVTLLRGGQNQPAYGYASAFGALAMSLGFAAALLAVRPGAMFEPLSTRPARRGAQPPLEAPDDPREAALLAALNQEMRDNRAYRDERLSIARLAARLGIPEYRLRRLINQRLGHRNFSAFLNAYRLEEVMAWLADTAQAEAGILTLALDAGFPSVVSFNRAFKAHTGVTPSEYRRRHLKA